MRMLCNRAEALVFAVHTRLAPEHTYPAAHDDALAATLAIMADVEKWHGDPARIALAGDSDSYRQLGDDYLITRDMLLSGFHAYLGEQPVIHPEASPLHHPALSGLPPTHIITAEYDPLRDEGEAFYRKLLQAGVTTTCQRQLGVIHGFFQLAGVSPAARQLIEQLSDWLRNQ
ncbi:alpha/beta hydrolase [Aeromonas veronii]